MREKDGYRENLARLLEYFGNDHNLLSISDVAKYCGKNYRTVVNLYGLKKGGITIPTLARRMCD